MPRRQLLLHHHTMLPTQASSAHKRVRTLSPRPGSEVQESEPDGAGTTSADFDPLKAALASPETASAVTLFETVKTLNDAGWPAADVCLLPLLHSSCQVPFKPILVHRHVLMSFEHFRRTFSSGFAEGLPRDAGVQGNALQKVSSRRAIVFAPRPLTPPLAARDHRALRASGSPVVGAIRRETARACLRGQKLTVGYASTTKTCCVSARVWTCRLTAICSCLP
jgi:hypothetical protein